MLTCFMNLLAALHFLSEKKTKIFFLQICSCCGKKFKQLTTLLWHEGRCELNNESGDETVRNYNSLIFVLFWATKLNCLFFSHLVTSLKPSADFVLEMILPVSAISRPMKRPVKKSKKKEPKKSKWRSVFFTVSSDLLSKSAVICYSHLEFLQVIIFPLFAEMQVLPSKFWQPPQFEPTWSFLHWRSTAGTFVFKTKIFREIKHSVYCEIFILGPSFSVSKMQGTSY